jgi:hypothetical protein
MSTLPGIECNDAPFAAEFSAWLAGSGIPLPDGFRLRIEVSDTIPAAEDPRTVYSIVGIGIQAGEPLGVVHLGWDKAPAWARIEEHRPEATVHLSRQALADPDLVFRTFLLVVVIFILRRDGRYHMHAGTAIDPHGRGWLLVGNSGSGKSTTTALLASRGWRVGTDDIAFLTQSGDRTAVQGFRSPIALRPGGYDHLAREGGIPLTRRGKTGFYPVDLGAEWVLSVEPEFVVLTALGEPPTRLEPISPRAAMKALIQSSPWVMFEATAAQEHLDLLARLGRQAACFQATLAPDLFTAPGALEDFLP